MDISPEMVRIASQRYPNHNFSTVDMEEEESSSGTFDVICKIAVIHHNRYNTQASILRQLSNQIKRYGFLVLFESLGERIDIIDSGSAIEFPMPASDWINALNGLGFELT